MVAETEATDGDGGAPNAKKKKIVMTPELADKYLRQHADNNKQSLYMYEKSLPTGLETLDWAVGYQDEQGRFGFKGRGFIEIAGPESSGKTTHALQLCRGALDRYPSPDAYVILIDAEDTTDYRYMSKFGLTPENCIRVVPKGMGDLHMIFGAAVKATNKPLMIVLDSIPAVNLGERLAETIQMGQRAGLFSDFFGRWNTPIQQAGIAVVMINQLRENISTDQYKTSFAMQKIENDYKTPGGWAFRFFFSVRIFLQPRRFVKVKLMNWATNELVDTPTQVLLKAHVVKNKTSDNVDKYRQVEYYLDYLTGIDRVHSLIAAAVKHDVVVQRGSYYSFSPTKCPSLSQYKAQGEQKFVELIKGLPDTERESVLQSMLGAMNWDRKVNREAVQIEGIVEESVDSGEVLIRDVSPQLIEQAKAKSSVIEQAMLLGLINKRGRYFKFSNVSNTKLENLWKALSDEQRQTLEGQVKSLLEGSEAVVEFDGDDNLSFEVDSDE